MAVKRLLLIAYEFPPAFTPQALRWVRFAESLVERGWDVHVLAPELYLPEGDGFNEPSGVTVHRCSPGWFTAAVSSRRRARRAGALPPPDEHGGSMAPVDPTDAAPVTAPAISRGALNWKGRLHALLQRTLDLARFPDSRAEWLGPARARLDILLDTLSPDVVVSSHEPAVSLMLGLHARQRGFRWLADLGDPVLAGYTPWHWHARARALEARVLRLADGITVTNQATRDLLCRRHGVGPERVHVVGQGFQSAPGEAMPEPRRDSTRPLQLLYTGRFYAFRDPSPLFAAVNATPGVRLTVAAPELSRSLHHHFAHPGGRVRYAGSLSHDEIAGLQRDSDVLVNIGNRDPIQTPGKIYEYFGACRPILHLAQREPDPVIDEVARRRRGWSCASRADAIAVVLARLKVLHGQGKLTADLDLAESVVADCSWAERTAILDRILGEIAVAPVPTPQRLPALATALAD